MHYLKRASSPACLSQFQHGRDNWNNVSEVDKKSIWNELNDMQAGFCAYCERSIKAPDQHIDHFVQKSRQPQLTFKWDNLFGSCNRESSCGKHKDNFRPHYNQQDLIKPDQEDPEYFFVFASDGSIAIRNQLNEAEKKRAQATLNILNLDVKNVALRSARRVAVEGFKQTSEAIWSIAQEYRNAGLPDTDWQNFLDQELAESQRLQFTTAIKHVLKPQTPS
jgi:uncharacterized protein (TIGR02646 family)